MSLSGLPRRQPRLRASRSTPGSGEVAVISSDSPLPSRPGDVSADPEPTADVAASCILRGTISVKTENAMSLLGHYGRSRLAFISLYLFVLSSSEEDVPGWQCSLGPRWRFRRITEFLFVKMQDDSNPRPGPSTMRLCSHSH